MWHPKLIFRYDSTWHPPRAQRAIAWALSRAASELAAAPVPCVARQTQGSWDSLAIVERGRLSSAQRAPQRMRQRGAAKCRWDDWTLDPDVVLEPQSPSPKNLHRVCENAHTRPQRGGVVAQRSCCVRAIPSIRRAGSSDRRVTILRSSLISAATSWVVVVLS